MARRRRRQSREASATVDAAGAFTIGIIGAGIIGGLYFLRSRVPAPLIVPGPDPQPYVAAGPYQLNFPASNPGAFYDIYKYGSGVVPYRVNDQELYFNYPPSSSLCNFPPSLKCGAQADSFKYWWFHDVTVNMGFSCGGNPNPTALFGDEEVLFFHDVKWNPVEPNGQVLHHEWGIRFDVTHNIVYGYIEDDFASAGNTFQQLTLLNPNDSNVHTYRLVTSVSRVDFYIDGMFKGSFDAVNGYDWASHSYQLSADVHRVSNFTETSPVPGFYWMKYGAPSITIAYPPGFPP